MDFEAYYLLCFQNGGRRHDIMVMDGENMGGYGPGFGIGMFSLFTTIFPIVFLVVLGLILVRVFKGFGQWRYNNKQPVLSVRSRLVGKRMDVSHHHHHNQNGIAGGHSSTTYYVTFEVESGDRMEMTVNGREYGLLVEGDIGKLTFQGTRFMDFEREG